LPKLCVALSTRSEPQIGLALKRISLTTGTDSSENKINQWRFIVSQNKWKCNGSTVQHVDGANEKTCLVLGEN